MCTRIRENIKHFFECFCEVVPPTDQKEAWVIQKFPDSYKDEEVLKSVPKFAFPCEFENDVVQHYSFVLTDIESKWTFGFCRHDPKSQTALVFLSYHPWHQAFYKLLNTVAVLTHSPRCEDLTEFLTAAYNQKDPTPGAVFSVHFNRGENRNLTEYFSAADSHNMMVIFASMLYERRIIFTSKKLSRLSACVQSANDIIYPMIWQHIFIPVLPMALIDYLLAPMPFLIGVPEAVYRKVNKSDIGEVVILDADENTIETPFDDLNSLPQEVVVNLKKQLRNRSLMLGDGIPRAFLRALVQLIGGYRDALRFQQGERITFNQEAFIESRPTNMQPFLRKMLQLQIFQQFIEERLQMLNSGSGFSDEFEMEACSYSEEKTSSKLKQQYKEWTYTMKKEGSAFIKSVKEKANPAMKSAVKSVKDGGKGMRSAYKGLKSRFRDTQGVEELHENTSRVVAEKPRSAPSSPTVKRKSLNFSAPPKSYRKDIRHHLSTASERPYSPLSPMSPDTPDRLDMSDMNLMDELQEILSKYKILDEASNNTTPPIDRSLKPVRSLDSFGQRQSQSHRVDGWGDHFVDRNHLLSPLSPTNPFATDLISGPVDPFGGDAFPTFPIDTVKLSPPSIPSTSRRKEANKNTDLIRLDSSDIEDFDPLAGKNQNYGHSSQVVNPAFPGGLTNPLYSYYVPPLLGQSNANAVNGNVSQPNKNEQEFPKEYPFQNGSLDKKNPQSSWTKFD